MRKKVMGILFCMIMVFEIVAGNKGLIDVQAANVKHKSTTKDYQFAVPEGGWSTIRVYVNYTENYTPKADSMNKYYRREIYYAYKTSYATTRPSFRLLNNISYKDKNDKVLHTFKNGLHVMQCRMEHGNILQQLEMEKTSHIKIQQLTKW